MILGKVIGTVWATRKNEQLRGLTLQLVRELDPDGTEKSRCVVVVDSVGAGVGETLLFVQGSSARQTDITKNKPIDAVIVAIVDKMDVEGSSS